MFLIEGGGLVTADTLYINSNIIQIDASGALDVRGHGLLAGPGEGLRGGGAGHGGRGDRSTATSELSSYSHRILDQK